MELRAIVGVETNLEAPKNRCSPHLTFRGSDLRSIAGDALMGLQRTSKQSLGIKIGIKP